jgi:hypothetical protein
MKYILLVLVFSGMTALRAQQLVENRSISLISPVTIQTEKKIDSRQFRQALPGERMRNTGKALTFCGSALVIGGIALLSNAESTHYQTGYGSSGSYEEGDPKGAFGAVMLTGGIGMIVPGIIFWSKGAKKYKAASQEVDVEASIRFRSNGLAIRLRL